MNFLRVSNVTAGPRKRGRAGWSIYSMNNLHIFFKYDVLRLFLRPRKQTLILQMASHLLGLSQFEKTHRTKLSSKSGQKFTLTARAHSSPARVLRNWRQNASIFWFVFFHFWNTVLELVFLEKQHLKKFSSMSHSEITLITNYSQPRRRV